MLQGADGIRTRVKDNPDGGTTLLRTRGGMPEFKTVSVGSSQVCVLGPFTEMDYLSREWYPKAETELEKTQFDIRTTDGIFLRHLRPLKTMKVRQGTPPAEGASDRRKEMEFWFSRDNGVTPATAPVSTADVKKAIWEYGPRTFYPSVPAQETGITKAGLHYAIKRIETLKLQFPTRQRVTYTFSRMFIEIVAPATHTCTNQAAEEKTLKQRTYFAAPETGDADALEKVKLTVGSRKLVQIECANRGWFLDYIGGPSLTRSSGLLEGVPPTTDDTYLRYGLVEIGNESGSPEAVNLSKVDMFGVMWHGLAFADHILVTPDLPREPFDYTPADYAASDDGSVHYVKSPADLPEPVTPAALDILGAKFLNYALFFGTDKRYSTTGPFALGASGFIHFDDAARPRWLKLEVEGYLMEYPPVVDDVVICRDSFTVVLYDGGEPKVSMLSPTWVKIAEFPFTHEFKSEPDLPNGDPVDYSAIAFEFTTPVSAHRVGARPDGRKAAIEITQTAGVYFPLQPRMVLHIVEVTLSGDLEDITAEKVWNAHAERSYPGYTYAGHSQGVSSPNRTTIGDLLFKTTAEKYFTSGSLAVYHSVSQLAVAFYNTSGVLVLTESTMRMDQSFYHEVSDVWDETKNRLPNITSQGSLLREHLSYLDLSLYPEPPDPVPTPDRDTVTGEVLVQSVRAVTGAPYDYTYTLTDTGTRTGVYGEPTFTYSESTYTKTYTCGDFEEILGPSTLRTIDFDSDDEYRDVAVHERTLRFNGFQAFTNRTSNSTAKIRLHNETIPTSYIWNLAEDFPIVAVVSPTALSLIDAPEPIYATYHPVTGELSVGDTLRCFV